MYDLGNCTVNGEPATIYRFTFLQYHEQTDKIGIRDIYRNNFTSREAYYFLECLRNNSALDKVRVDILKGRE